MAGSFEKIREGNMLAFNKQLNSLQQVKTCCSSKLDSTLQLHA